MEKAELRIAGPWTRDQIASLCDRLALRYDESASFAVKRDDELIGGFVAKIDGKVLDASIKSKLAELSKRLTADA